ncbi:MAG: NAD(P)-binding protein [Sphingomonadales bacterium]|nr:NAD(P)-binding protein [Sphingomonadales bacterium]
MTDPAHDAAAPAGLRAFPRLFAPLTLGRETLQNRVVILPHGTSMLRDGAITDDDIEYYRRRASTRPGMIITGAAVVHPSSARRPRGLVEDYSEHVLPGLARRAAMMREHGVVPVGQLVHLGRELIGMDSDVPTMGPSAIRSPRDPFVPREMDEADIAEIVAAFGHSSANLKRTGHAGVEIHAAHGYLPAQFLSPATNQRSDRYGGDPARRFRFLQETIEAIRRDCGDDFLLGVRLSADEETGEGIEIPDTLRIVEQLQAMGGVDYVSITLGVRGAYVKDVSQPEATAARAAGIVRENCDLPVIVGQRITRPELAEQILAEGKADMIGMARAFIADPDWLARVREGTAERVRPCLGLNQDCRAFAPHLHCAVNPQAGRERVAPFDGTAAAAASRRIAIIGGGPAGLEFARSAALRGHRPEIFEATDGVGGQFLYAASVPNRAGLRKLIDFYQTELRRLAVPIHLERPIAGPADLGLGFDEVVLATGARARPVPDELAGATVRDWWSILAEGAPPPSGEGHALMVDDGTGFWWNYGVAEALVAAGWRVTYVTPAAAVGYQIPVESMAPLLARLGRGPTRFRILTQLFGIEDGTAQLVDMTSGTFEDLACDLIVLQTGREPVSLAEAFAGRDADGGGPVHRIGDCIAPRRMANAVLDGQRLGMGL